MPKLSRRRFLTMTAGTAAMSVLAACGEAEVTEKTVTVTVTEVKEVIKEVPVETVVRQEVIKEVPIETVVTKEIIKEVPVEVVKEVQVETIVTKEVVKEIPVERVVIKEVATPSRFSEAPMLAARVQAGSLPPVDSRLPKDPWVIEPVEQVGNYGGTLRLGGIRRSIEIGYGGDASLMAYAMTGTELFLDLAKNLDVSSDLQTFTFEIREGHKWSDGAPFTADDFMFTYEDFWGNDLANPSGSLQHGAERIGLREIVKVEDTVVEFKFDRPAPQYLDRMGRYSGDPWVFSPRHYLERFHEKYNSDAQRLAEKAGFETWADHFKSKFYYGPSTSLSREDAAFRPALGPWVNVGASPDVTQFARNPYYHAVDTAGNQLPYIDYVNHFWIKDKEVYQIKVTAGELDFAQFVLDLKNMELYRAEEDRGGYRTLVASSLRTSAMSLFPNQTYKDPAVAAIFREKDFRVAASVAINREAINETLFFGLARPFTPYLLESYSFFKPEWGTLHTEYDPDQANSLLDGIGLDKRDSDGWRLRPDGERFSILLTVSDQEGPKEDMATLIVKDWQAVGLHAEWQFEEEALFRERAKTFTEVMMPQDISEAAAYFTRWASWHYGMDTYESYWAGSWAQWIQTDGAEGEEPPDWMKEAKRLREEWRRAVPGSAEYDDLGVKFWSYFYDQYPIIGTVGYPPQPTIVNQSLRNVPTGINFAAAINFVRPYGFPQFYYDG